MTDEFDYVIRPSSLPTWDDCARRTAARSFPELVHWGGYEVRQISSHVGACVGTATHAGAAFSLESKMTTGDLGPEDEACDRGVEAFNERMEVEGCTFDPTTQNRSTAHKQITRMIRMYRSRHAPKLSPAKVEERANVTLGDGFGLSGQPDTLTQEDQDMGRVHHLRDLKTGTVRRANGAQYGAYSLLWRSHGIPVTKIYEDYLPRVPLSKEQPPVEPHRIGMAVAENDALRVIEDIKGSVANFIQLGNAGRAAHTAFRPNPMSVLCSDKFCPAWGTKFCRSHLDAGVEE